MHPIQIILIFLLPYAVSYNIYVLRGITLVMSDNLGGRDSSVGIATRYRLDVRESNPGGERDFPHPSRPALGSTQPPIQWVPSLSRGKRGRGVVLSTHPPSKTEVIKG